MNFEPAEEEKRVNSKIVRFPDFSRGYIYQSEFKSGTWPSGGTVTITWTATEDCWLALQGNVQGYSSLTLFCDNQQVYSAANNNSGGINAVPAIIPCKAGTVVLVKAANGSSGHRLCAYGMLPY